MTPPANVSSALTSGAFTIEEATISQLQHAMEHEQVTAKSLTESYLSRISALDSHLNAIITDNPAALADAERLDELRAQGQIFGPLHGVPLIVKDNIDVADLPTTGGCKALAEAYPPNDAFVVSRLRAAGAIILAKANMHELAIRGESVSSLGGQVCNPYAPDHTPGGSSGGCGAAIAANFAVAALCTDTINSVRSPASACNLVGLRPTDGLVSRDGVMPVALTQDTVGPMARSVTDLALVLESIAGNDSADSRTARTAGQPVGNYTAELVGTTIAGKRLGLLSSLLGSSEQHQQVSDCVTAAVETLTEKGATCYSLPVNVDTSKLQEELSVVRWEWQRHFNDYLTTLKTTPVRSLSELGKSKQVHPSIRSSLQAAIDMKSPLGDGEYWQRRYARRAQLREWLFYLFERYQLDALVYPHQSLPVAKIGEPQQNRNGIIAAASGFPALTVPAGFTSAGLPVGIEFLGKPFSERSLLQIGYGYEQASQWRKLPVMNSAA